MKFWKQWSRKLDGWAERRRRFQKASPERVLELAGQNVPAVEGRTAPANVPEFGKSPGGAQ